MSKFSSTLFNYFPLIPCLLTLISTHSSTILLLIWLNNSLSIKYQISSGGSQTIWRVLLKVELLMLIFEKWYGWKILGDLKTDSFVLCSKKVCLLEWSLLKFYQSWFTKKMHFLCISACNSLVLKNQQMRSVETRCSMLWKKWLLSLNIGLSTDR